MTYGKDHADCKGLYDLGIPELYRTTPQEYDLYSVSVKLDGEQIAPERTFDFASYMQETSPEWSEGRLSAILKRVRNSSINRRLRDSVSPRPPLNITKLFALFLTSEMCAAVVGDLQERYAKVFRQRGHTHATLWFLKQTAISLMPFVWAALKRVSGVEAIYRRIGR
jgi:hypothetical protein